MSEGSVTDGVDDLLPAQAGVQQLPLSVRQIVLQVNVARPVGHIHLTDSVLVLAALLACLAFFYAIP